MAVFGGVTSKIKFGENWRDRYGLYYGVKTGYTRLSLTFFHKNRPYRPIYPQIKKNRFSKKNDVFLIEN